MSAPTHSHAWRCTVPDCCGPRSQGAGYGSESAANKARQRHIASAHLRLTARLGVER